MGRRGSRTTHQCAIREVRVDNGDYMHGTGWCGNDRAITTMGKITEGEDRLAFSRRMADCSKCSAAIGKVRLQQLGGRVKLVEQEMPTTSWGKVYRAFYGVEVDGIKVGYILMDNGWGNPWQLHELTDDPSRRVGGLMSSVPGRYSAVSPDNPFQPVHTRSKEMLASAALRLRDAGKLRTLEEMAAHKAARQVREAAQAAERAEESRLRGIELERKANLRDERKALALDWLHAVLEMSDLTNSQRAGAMAAQEIISGKDVV